MADNDAAVDYILELKEYLQQRFRAQKEMIKHSRELRQLRHAVHVPDAYRLTAKVYRTPIIKDMTQRVTAQLSVNYPTWQRIPLGVGPKAQALTGLLEKWQVAAHKRMEEEAARRIFRQGMSAAIKDGMGVWELIDRPTAWTPWPRRKRGERDEETEDAKGYTNRVAEFTMKRPFRFHWRDVDPLDYYYHDPDGLQEVLLIQKLPHKPAMKALGVRYNPATKGYEKGDFGPPLAGDAGATGNEVECITYCNGDEYAYLLDGKLADRRAHQWGKPPFFHFAGLSSHERNPENEFLGVAFAFEHLVPLLDDLITAKMNWAIFGAYPRTVIKLTEQRLAQMTALLPPSEDGAAKVAQMVEESLGNVITLYTGEEAAFMSLPPVGADLNQMIQMTMQLIDAAGISNVLRGQMPGGDPNGYLYNQMTTMAHMAYDPVTDNARAALRAQSGMLLYGVEHIAKRDVYVWGEQPKSKTADWLKLGPEDVDGYYDVKVDLEPLLPSNYIMEGTFWLNQWKAGGVPWRTYVEEGLHQPDPDELEKQMLVEDFKNSPEMRRYRSMQIAQRLGMVPPPETTLPPQFQPGPGAAGMMGGPGQPATPGQGLPLDPSQVTPGQVPAMPGNNLPGAGPAGLPGGNYGRQVPPVEPS